jgi:hypothetical protein
MPVDAITRRALLAGSVGAAAAFAAEQSVPAEVARLVESAYDFWRRFAPAVWSGTEGTTYPFVYVDAEAEYAFNFPAVAASWKPLSRTAMVRPRTLPVDIEASMHVDGVSCALLGSPAATKREGAVWVLKAAHEFFHVHQYANGSIAKCRRLEIGPENDPSWQLEFPFPYKDASTMKLMHLQGYLCYQAIQTATLDEVKYCAGAVLEAASLYREELDRLDASGKSHRYSMFQEWNEGVAFYAEYLAAKAASTKGGAFGAVWDNEYSRRPFLVKHAGRAAKSRTAFYHLGMGKALLLDRLGRPWKQDYFKNGVWLDDQIAAAIA